jgi:hypothetical protein
MEPEEVVPRLMQALDDRIRIPPVAMALAAYGHAARSAVPSLTSALQEALARTEYVNADCLAHAIEATAADPAAEICNVLAECDEELRPQAEHMLADHPVWDDRYAPGRWFGETCQ